MQKFEKFGGHGIMLAILVTPYTILPAQAQAIFESGGTNAMAAGLGAGAAASAGKGKFLQRAYTSAAEAERNALAETQAIQGYMKQGCEFEAKKQWANAEQCFRYCLQVSAMRDGPGSPKMIPTLEHLVNVKAAQNEILDAIGFQQRLVSFAKLDKAPDPARIISTEITLSNLLLQKQDYQHAETTLSESYNLARTTGGISTSKRKALCQTYAHVLRSLHKDEAAASVDAALAALVDEPAPNETAKATNAEVVGQDKTNAHPGSSPAQTDGLSLAKAPEHTAPTAPVQTTTTTGSH